MAQQARAINTRALILEGAAQVFEERGFLAARLDEIADRIGFTKGALYFHFRSKEALAAAVIAEQHAISRRYADQALQEGTTGLECMLLMCAGLAEQLTTRVIVRAGIRLTTDHSASIEVVSGPYLDWMTVFEGLISRAKSEEDFDEHIDPGTVAHFIIPAYTGVQLVSDALVGRQDLFERIAEMWRLLLPALSTSHRLEHSIELVDNIMSSRELLCRSMPQDSAGA